jgi:glycosyltransferase involved in cell wall biosynthesis
MKQFVVVYKHLLARGGVPYETRALIGGLEAAGAHVLVLCDQAESSEIDPHTKVINEFDKGDDFAPSRQMPYSFWLLLRSIRAPGTRDRVYLLIGCRRLDYLFFALMIRLGGARFFVLAHGLLAPELLDYGWGGRRKNILRRLLERAFRQLVDRPLLWTANAVRALSATEANRLKALGARVVFDVADGIDRDWVAKAVPDEAPALRPLGLLYLGRPDPFQTGLDVLLLALKGLVSQQAFELVLAGPDVGTFRNAVVDVFGHVPPWIKIIGMVTGPDKLHCLNAAHFFIHVSRFEGMAKSAREAVARGLPVIATYESNFGDWVEQRRMGLATAATTDGVRAALMRALAVSSHEWCSMRNEAIGFAVEQSWASVALRIMLEADRLGCGSESAPSEARRRSP